jgi:eukaryotic-like serine/threonine-protein kinase
LSARGDEPGHDRDDGGEEAQTAGLEELENAGRLSAGTAVGRYLILDAIGTGGAGYIYSAYDSQLERKVAIKILHAAEGGSSQGRLQGQERLLREAQAMARLNHPNVVAVHDVGVHDERVFMAMELVDGGTLRQWLASPELARRPPRARRREVLALFIGAGRGLAAAHAAGLVHRDFKPDNVLLRADGRPLVTDFGLVRTDAERAARSEVVMGTPGYMAPEQYLAEPTDERTDQFSYCVSLYEALYQSRPFARPSLTEAREATLAGVPPDPPRGGDVPAWLRRVIVRGLAVKPDDRWPSMAALLSALEHDPEARRRRLFTVAAALVAVAALALGGWSVAARRARRCEEAAAAVDTVFRPELAAAIERQFAASKLPFAAPTFRLVNDALSDYARSWSQARRDLCFAEERGQIAPAVATARSECLDEGLAQLRTLVEVMRSADGRIVERAVPAVQSLPPSRLCSDRTESARPGAADRYASVRKQLAAARALEAAARYKESGELVRRAREQARGEAALDAEATVLAADLQADLDDFAAAEQTYKHGLALAEVAGDDLLRARIMSGLVYVVGYWLGRGDEGLDWGRLAQAVLERVGGNDDIQATLWYRMAQVHHEGGRHAEELAEGQKALALRERMYGRSHPSMASLHQAIGDAWTGLGEGEKAVSEYRNAVSITEQVYGPDHPALGDELSNLGLALSMQNQHDEALGYIRRALDLKLKVLSPEDASMAVSYTHYGRALRRAGRLDEARPWLDHSVRIYESHFSPLYVGLIYPLIDLGWLALAEHQPKRAVPLFERALKIQDRESTQVYKRAENRIGLAQALLDSGRDRPRVEKLAKEATELMPALGGRRKALSPAFDALVARLGHGEPHSAPIGKR